MGQTGKLFFYWIYPFSKSKKSSWSLGVVVGGFGIRHPLHHHHLKLWQEKFLKFSKSKKSSWSSGEVKTIFFSGFIHFMKFPAFLVKEWKNKFLVDLSSSWNFLHFWFRCDFSHTLPPPPPQTLMRKFSKSKWAKHGKKFIYWIYPSSKSKKSSWSLGVVVEVGCLNITSTNSGTFYIWEDG